MDIFGRPEPDFTLRFDEISLDEKTKSESEKSMFRDDKYYEGITIDECYESENGAYAGKKVAWQGPWIPWNGSIGFEAIEISCTSTVNIVDKDVSIDFERSSPKQNADGDFKFDEDKTIEGKLKLRLEDTGPRLSMFGTKELINDFTFIIATGSQLNREGTELEGGIRYGGFNIHHGETEDTEYLRIMVGINQQRFDEISKLINQKRLNSFLIDIGGVEGFYRELSADFGNRFNPLKVKVLTTEIDHHKIPKKYKKEVRVLGKAERVRIDAVTSQSFSEEDNHQVGDNENEKDERDL